MNFPVTLFRSDLKKNELFISMSQNSSSQSSYPVIQEIRVSQLDSAGNSQRPQSQQTQNEQNGQQIVFELNDDNTLNQLGVINSNQVESTELPEPIDPVEQVEQRSIEEEYSNPMDEIELEKEIERELEMMNVEQNNEIYPEESRNNGNAPKEYKDYKQVFIEFAVQGNDMIQNQNTLKKFLERYNEIIGDADFESLERILLRIFYERLMLIYHFTRSYDITYPMNALDQGAVNYLMENINRFIDDFRNALFNSYLDIADHIPEDLKPLMPEYRAEGNERLTELNFKTLQEYLRNNVCDMKDRMNQLPERFLTALFFRYMYGVCVLPIQFRESIDLLLTDILVPYVTGEKYVNEILFMGYWQSVPENVVPEPQKIKEVIEKLLNSKQKMTELARRTIVELIKAKKSAKTVNQGNTLTSLTNANMRLLNAINKRNGGELKRQYIEKRGDDDGEATRYMNEVERFKFEETKPKKFGQQIYINIENSLNMLSEAIENGDERTLYSLLDIKHILEWEKEKEKKGQSHFYFKPNYKKGTGKDN